MPAVCESDSEVDERSGSSSAPTLFLPSTNQSDGQTGKMNWRETSARVRPHHDRLEGEILSRIAHIQSVL
jgi:hypothetical protein